MDRNKEAASKTEYQKWEMILFLTHLNKFYI